MQFARRSKHALTQSGLIVHTYSVYPILLNASEKQQPARKGFAECGSKGISRTIASLRGGYFFGLVTGCPMTLLWTSVLNEIDGMRLRAGNPGFS